MDRKTAKQLGIVKYKGRPCKVCGSMEKYTSNWSCVECTNKNTKQRSPEVYKKYISSEKGKLWRREYEKTEICRDVQNKWKKGHYKRNPDVYHRYSLKKYDITKEQWNDLFESQNGSCAICNTSFEQLSKRPAVDHDHVTGKVRSLLCHKCNTALGLLNEDRITMQSMIEYVEKFQCESL